jgi:hypothetical protein
MKRLCEKKRALCIPKCAMQYYSPAAESELSSYKCAAFFADTKTDKRNGEGKLSASAFLSSTRLAASSGSLGDAVFCACVISNWGHFAAGEPNYQHPGPLHNAPSIYQLTFLDS